MGNFFLSILGLRKLGVEAVEVRKPEQLAGLAGLIIPGGESTTMAKLAEHYKMVSVSYCHTFSFSLLCNFLFLVLGSCTMLSQSI
jgi:glutamine amidotransferase PdxT